jgi:hypothetical protein
MAGSLKDALKKAGLAPAEQAAPKPKKTKSGWREDLPADETLPPLFEAPPLTTAVDPAIPKKR